MTDIREEKNAVREKYKALRLQMDPEEKALFDEAICVRVMNLTSYRFADVILMYAAENGEIDVTPIFNDALKKGKKTAFPLCVSDGVMEYRIVSSLSDLEEGKYGIPAPKESCPKFDKYKSGNYVCITPALVYDKRGYRLGYGRGYYDRYLEDFKGTKLGLCYSAFVADRIPTGKHDLRIDTLITEKGVMSFAKN